MASLTIRNLDNHVKEQLRLRAARHGCSMEAEVRTILAQTLNAPVREQNLAATIHRRFESLDIESLPVPPRKVTKRAVAVKWDDFFSRLPKVSEDFLSERNDPPPEIREDIFET